MLSVALRVLIGAFWPGESNFVELAGSLADSSKTLPTKNSKNNEFSKVFAASIPRL